LVNKGPLGTKSRVLVIQIMRSGQKRLDDFLIPANRGARPEAYPILSHEKPISDIEKWECINHMHSRQSD
jgi:hypothetical protein